MASIKDVAKLAGVSVTTVSRVLNSRGYIGSETRQKVEDAIKQLDYQPNQIARALLKNQSYIIGIVVPDLSHPFFFELVNWVESCASEHNYKVLVCNSMYDAEKEIQQINMLRQNQVDGIIMCSHMINVESYQNISIPIVSFDRILSAHTPYVAGDSYKGGELAANHLIEKGCRNILHISGPLEYELLANRRSDACQLLCLKHGVELKLIEGNFDQSKYEDNWEFIDQVIGNQMSQYDGIFCSNDIMAYTAYVYANENGMIVPDDLKIIGYDYHQFTRLLQQPKLTTIRQPIDRIAHALCSVLIQKIENPDSPTVNNIIIDVDLIPGTTT